MAPHSEYVILRWVRDSVASGLGQVPRTQRTHITKIRMPRAGVAEITSPQKPDLRTLPGSGRATRLGPSGFK
ncbi:unnamed protein product, partial [Amoebophrya sp. A120]|eukprot:GSA120T00012111001.1